MTEITLSDELAGRIEERIQHTEFESVDEYAAFVLSEVVTRVERETDDETAETTASAEAVEDRLQSLGYLGE